MGFMNWVLPAAVQARYATLRQSPRLGPALAALAIIGCLFPIRAEAYVDYGFNIVDNSAGGSIMDNYITQELWADTDLRWLGNQLRLELDQGTIFQDDLEGSSLTTESSHDLLAATFDQPSLAYDTRIGVNGQAPNGMPGGAINLGGSMGLQFTESEINIAYGPGGGQHFSGEFNFGTLTLSKDAVGRGAVLFSMSGPDWIDYGHYAQTFEVEDGVIRFTGERVNLQDPNYNYTLENWQFVRHEIPRRPPEPEPEPPIIPSDPPPVDAPPEVEPDPVPPPEPVDLPIVIEFPPDPTPTPEVPNDPHEPGECDPLILRPIQYYLPDFSPENLEIWTGPGSIPLDWDLPGNEVVLTEGFILNEGGLKTALSQVTATTGSTEFAAGRTALYATPQGEPAVLLDSLSEESVAELLATGDWSIRGAALVFGRASVPEPSSIALALLLVGASVYWRWSNRGRDRY